MSFKFGKSYEQIVPVTADYTVGQYDDVIQANATGGPIAVTLNSTSNPDCIVQKTDSSANAVTVTATINGATNYALTSQNQSSRFRRSNTGVWFTFEGLPEGVAVASELNAFAALIPTTTYTALTDNSGGTANNSTGLAANAVKQTFIIPIQLLGLVNAGVWKIAVPFAATVLSALFRTGKVVSTAAKAATLTVTTNGGGAVTGGVMALTSANQGTTGTGLAASAISGAGATITAGQTIEVTVSSVTAFVEGDGYVEFVVSNNDLANAIATLAAQSNTSRSRLQTATIVA
jgi:hypothetical protein